MKKNILIGLTAFIFGSLVTYYSVTNNFIKNNSQIENKYLLNSLKLILKTDAEKRTAFISKSPIFGELEEIQSLSSSKNHYYWFSWNEEGLASIGLNKIPKESSNFFGFYVVINNVGFISDFGFHKP